VSVASLAARLRTGEALISGWSSLADPVVAEIVGRQGFDCVVLDMQHGLHDIGTVGRCLASLTLAGKPTIVRVPLGDSASASRALDLGAAAVIAPVINSAAEARAFVAATKYPPVGERSWGPTRALTLHGIAGPAYLDAANTETLTIVMIETARALAAIAEILVVPGIDGVFVGPHDLSVTMSAGKSVAPADPAVDKALGTIVTAAAGAGKFACIYAPTAERARRYRELGYQLIAVGSDAGYLAAGATEVLAAIRRT